MFDLIKGFPAQLLAAVEIGEKIQQTSPLDSSYKNVLVSGLGGSGIGGNLLAELLKTELDLPIIVNKGYTLPAFVGNDTLLILCSYSGDTEETISCLNEAIKRGLRPICITSGGTMAATAKKRNLLLVNIPSGFPPRTCLGYSIVELFFVLFHTGLMDAEFKSSLIRTASFLEVEQHQIREASKMLASHLVKKAIIAYAEDKYESCALRLKQQLNENAKMQCWYNVLPEMNHNELVGWRERHDNLAAVFLRTDDENPRNSHRIEFSKNVIRQLPCAVHEILAKGRDTFEKHFYLIHFADWLLYDLAVLQGHDPMEIDVLNKLKSHLGTIA